jgi:phosphoglucomutase
MQWTKYTLFEKTFSMMTDFFFYANMTYMISKNELNTAIDKLILSASGWRGIFAPCGEEEGTAGHINETHRIICASAAYTFAEYLQRGGSSPNKNIVLLGCDTRPTGKSIINAMIPVLLSAGFDVRYTGFIAAPEIMAWARNMETEARGFIYITASHNPIGYNGIKFGLTDGGVLTAEEAVVLIANFRSFLEKDDCLEKIESIVSGIDSKLIEKVYAGETETKVQARKAYFNFCEDVVWGGSTEVAAGVKAGLKKNPLGIVCDFNGSARTVSIDAEFFNSLGLVFDCINVRAGKITHRIVPEGESLDPCCALLEKAHARDASFMLGYVPDCDGDRGNLVIWDDASPGGKARALEAQEVFALACVAELAHLVWTGELAYDENDNALTKAAIAVNDPTSMRIDRIAEAFGIPVFRAEVGEANVVGLARRLRKEGYIVRILGEGSAGGNITYPSAVRDPLSTVLAIVKLLSVSSSSSDQSPVNGGLFKIWCKKSGQVEKYHSNFSLADIIESLPYFVTTSAYSDDAILQIETKDHAVLKDRYQKVFLREWEQKKDELKTRYGFYRWEVIAYNGLEERREIKQFGEAGKGGLKICFLNEKGKEAAYIWMRGSATEPVFRIMADVDTQAVTGSGEQIERDLLEWQRQMIMEADSFPKQL